MCNELTRSFRFHKPFFLSDHFLFNYGEQNPHLQHESVFRGVGLRGLLHFVVCLTEIQTEFWTLLTLYVFMSVWRNYEVDHQPVWAMNDKDKVWKLAKVGMCLLFA